ncbi:MAG: GHKL domain-containing protein [Gammaproteobacteria bacterium]|nr:GHKL domain-containing protein [Gammaproteobacteria bacterium]NNM10358.1 GHKL domain-containing protein [Pseudomonadales bacterium]
MPPPTSPVQAGPAKTGRAQQSTAARQGEPTGSIVKGADKEGLQATFELFNRMSDNLSESYRALEAQVAALTDELDRVNHQRELETQDREQVSSRLSNLLGLLPGGVIVLDRWGVVSQANPAAEELLERKLVGRKWVELIAECFAPRKDDWHEISLKNGKRVSLATRSLEVETGQIILLTDQTETRRLQEQVSRNERLSALGKMVSALAHQIRTPLSAAMLYAGHLSERELDAEKTQRFAEKIVSRLNHLERQVSDMLVFASGDVRLSDSAPVSELLQEVQQAAEVVLQANRVELKIEANHADCKIICNRQTMVGAICNLVNNAAQASEENAVITLSSQVNERTLSLTLADKGEGIEESVMARLQSGEAFVSTKAQGTGLGLAVVRAVVKAHQGSLDLQSQQGAGTTVTIQLPCFH